MSKIVELYVKELTREGSTMTINDVPKKLRKQVEDAIAAVRHELTAFTTETRTTLVSIAATVNQIVGASNHRG